MIYDSTVTSKEQIVSAPVFLAYPARILGDQEYSGTVQGRQIEAIPPAIEQKLNLLAQRLQARGVTLESFFQEELDDAISGGYWDKANNILDNLLSAFDESTADKQAI